LKLQMPTQIQRAPGSPQIYHKRLRNGALGGRGLLFSTFPAQAVVVSVALLILLSPTLLASEPPAVTTANLPALEAASSPFPTPIRHVIILLMEDQGVSDVLANGSFERYLATKYAFASQYYGLTSDSLANYRDIASGHDSNGTDTTLNVPTLVDNAGETWAAYEESMPTPCDETSTYANTTLPASVVGNQTNHLVYDTNHDPFVVFKNITANLAYCQAHVLNLDAWTTALQSGNLPNYVWIAPNDTDNDHHCPPATCPGAIPHGDAWLRAFLNPFLNSSEFSDSVVFLTFDYNSTEGYDTNLAHIYFAALSPYAIPGYSSPIEYTHYNLLTTTEWLLGLERTGYNDNWTTNPPMKDLFDFSSYYNVTFTESGLPSGTQWTVALNGVNESASTSSIVFSVKNGSYPFSVESVAGYTPVPVNGRIQVNGAPVSQAVQFAPPPPKNYAVTFSESGLASGTGWSVTLNGTPEASTTGSIVFLVPNGTYPYTVTSVATYTETPSSGNVIVSGAAPPPVGITFLSIGPPTYAVTFTESGLPDQTDWSVILNGSLQASTNDSIVFQMRNGTFGFTVGSVHGYLAQPQTGTLTVAGAPATMGVSFTMLPPTYPVTFTETGLPSGTNWSITLNGNTLFGEGLSIIFQVPNGTFAYTVGSVNGYAASPPSGNGVMNGTESWIYLEFSATHTNTALSLTSGWALYGIIAAIVVLAALISTALLAMSRRKRRSPPEKNPTSSEAPPSGPQ
jgi:Phosphoesterase family